MKKNQLHIVILEKAYILFAMYLFNNYRNGITYENDVCVQGYCCMTTYCALLHPMDHDPKMALRIYVSNMVRSLSYIDTPQILNLNVETKQSTPTADIIYQKNMCWYANRCTNKKCHRNHPKGHDPIAARLLMKYANQPK